MLNPNSSVVKFGNETSKEVTEIKWSHKGGTLIPEDQGPY